MQNIGCLIGSNMRKTILILLLAGGFCTLLPAQTRELLSQARLLISKDSVKPAVACFENVLAQEPSNYEALSFLCNYNYLIGKQKVDSIDAVFSKIQMPTRMQLASRQEALRKVYNQWIFKSEHQLIKAYSIQRNEQLDALAGKIAAFKNRIGLPNPGEKK